MITVFTANEDQGGSFSMIEDVKICESDSEDTDGKMDFIASEKNLVDDVRKNAYSECSWAKEPEKIPEAEIAETVGTEVLIVGGGIAGLAAGARCTDLELSCIVLEKYHGIVAEALISPAWNRTS